LGAFLDAPFLGKPLGASLGEHQSLGVPFLGASLGKHHPLGKHQRPLGASLGDPLGFPGSVERAWTGPRTHAESSASVSDESMCCHLKKQSFSSTSQQSLDASNSSPTPTSCEKKAAPGLFLNPSGLCVGVCSPFAHSDVVSAAKTDDGHRDHRSFQDDTTYDTFINCDVCFEQFSIDPDNSPKRPKVLSCLHTFCLACLFSLASKQEHRLIACPTCREVTALGPRGIRGLGNNYFLESFLSTISASSPVQPHHTAKMSPLTKTSSTACSEKMPEKDSLPSYETNTTQRRTFTSWAPIDIPVGLSVGTSTPGAALSREEDSMEWLQLDNWLPTILRGYDSTLVASFITDLRDEFGVVSTEDLVNLSRSGQLTFEVLGKINGFRIGHFNRLVIGLEKIIQV